MNRCTHTHRITGVRCTLEVGHTDDHLNVNAYDMIISCRGASLPKWTEPEPECNGNDYCPCGNCQATRAEIAGEQTLDRYLRSME